MILGLGVGHHPPRGVGLTVNQHCQPRLEALLWGLGENGLGGSGGLWLVVLGWNASLFSHTGANWHPGVMVQRGFLPGELL